MTRVINFRYERILFVQTERSLAKIKSEQMLDFSIRSSILLPTMLTLRQKQNVVKEHRAHDTDTGSPAVQIAL